MSEKKNIDRLFQEQFKDFEAAPPEYVWENIHEALQEKKKRRVIPLWIRLSGVAAVLLIGLAIGWTYFSSNGLGTDNDAVVIEHTADPALRKDGVEPSNRITPAGPGTDNSLIPPGQSNGAVVDAGTNDVNDESNGISTGNGVDTGNGTDTANGKSGSLNQKARSNSFSNPKDAVADGSGSGSTKGSDKSVNKRRHSIVSGINNNATDNAVAGTDVTNGRNGNGDNNNKINSQPATRNDLPVISGQDNRSAVAQNTAGFEETNSKGQGTITNPEIKGGVNKDIPVIDNVLPVQEAVAEVAVDSTKLKPENELEKLLREQMEGTKDEQLADNTAGKWNIKPQVAPVFYNSLSAGSPISGEFADNTKNFDNDLSYGVGVNYAVSSRLKIRSGINTVNLNYATQGVEFYASLSGSTSNVSSRARNANIVVRPKIEGQASSVVGFASNAADSYSGSMVQRTGYVEVPVEIGYALLNKKFGIEVIGGVSTLFLNQNNVSVVSTQGLSTSVGEADNLNNIHFSTNVGVGFKYRFLKSFEASFEPTFKYQVNTFSRDAGNFKPYFIGLYSGISFSF